MLFIFTYNDYLDCVENSKIQKELCFENKRNTIHNQRMQSKEENKSVEQVIKNEGEVANFINKYFNISNWKISRETIKKKCYLEKTKTAIYQYKFKEIYFFIKLQYEPNYNIAYTILNECSNFISKWKEKYPYHRKPPILVPIVIYIGKQQWNIKQNRNIRCTTFEKNCINLFYNWIDLRNNHISQ